MPPNTRPRTSKPRGICKYYTTRRGCLSGSSCKFLHGVAEQLDPQNPLLTPYDASKRCKFYTNGFCRRGDQCWFKHVAPETGVSHLNGPHEEEESQNEPCSICLEKPVTYGLLSGCSHIFCITCIRQWRDQKGENEHVNVKKCPMCREPCKFITPSSRFWRHGHPERDRATKDHRGSMARVLCRYFKESLEKDRSRPLCPFGRDCFYQHINEDGTPYVFKSGPEVCMRQYHSAMRLPMRSIFDEFIDLTSEFRMTVSGQRLSERANILSMQATVDGNPSENINSTSGDDQSRGNNLIQRQLRAIQRVIDNLESAVAAPNNSVARVLDMARMFLQQSIDTEHNPNLTAEAIENGDSQADLSQSIPLTLSNSQPPPLDSLVIRDGDNLDIPELQSVSNSSSSEVYLLDSDSDSEDDVSRLGMYLRSAASIRYRELPDHQEIRNDEDEEARMMQEIAERGPEEIPEGGPAQVSETDEPQIPIMDYENPMLESEPDHRRVTNPPFLTDGRGRVVWSSDGEANELASSGPRSSAEMADGTTSGDLKET